MRFGHEWSRGGLLVHYLTANAMEALGIEEMRKLIPQLDSAECRLVITQLLELDTQSEPVRDVIRRDEIWSQVALGWATRFHVALDELLQRPLENRQLFSEFERRRTALRRLLICELAVQAHCAIHGSPPASLHELVPEYFKAVPIDPYTLTSLRYRHEENTVRIYSIGPDGDDDHGKVIRWDELISADDGDLGLDSIAPFQR
jgi:hypothetical protein